MLLLLVDRVDDNAMIRLLEYKVDGMMLLYDWMIILSKMIGYDSLR